MTIYENLATKRDLEIKKAIGYPVKGTSVDVIIFHMKAAQGYQQKINELTLEQACVELN